MSYRNIIPSSNFHLQSFGQFGFRLLDYTGTGSPDGEQYRVIQALEACTIVATSESGDSLNGFNMEAGFTIYGLFTDINVVSGSVIAYIA